MPDTKHWADEIVKRPMAFDHWSDQHLAGVVRMLMRDDLEHESVCVAARDRIAKLSHRVAELEQHLAWIRRKLKLPGDAGMFSAGGIAGMLHVWDAGQHGYTAYIAAYRCDDKQGEIARLVKLNHELASACGCLEPGEDGRPSCDPPCIVCQALTPIQLPQLNAPGNTAGQRGEACRRA